MLKWFTALSIIILVLLGLFLFRNDSKELNIIDINQAQANVKEDIDKVKQIEEEVYKWISVKDMDVGHLEKHNSDVLEHYQKKEGVVEFLFATIFMNDPDLFIQSFKTEIISKDLFQVDNPNKLEVAEGFIQAISRNGKLKQVGLEEKRGILGNKTADTYVRLMYEDGVEATIVLAFEKSGTNHYEDDEIYSIKTSVNNIIEQIESTSE